MADKNLTTDEKLDLILKYQKKAAHWSMFRTISFWVIIIVFVVIPVVWSVKFINDLVAAGGIQGLQNSFRELQNSAGQIGDLQGLLKQLGQ